MFKKASVLIQVIVIMGHIIVNRTVVGKLHFAPQNQELMSSVPAFYLLLLLSVPSSHHVYLTSKYNWSGPCPYGL